MKKQLILAIVGMIFLFILSCEKKQHSESISSQVLKSQLTQQWATPQMLKVPESVLYDASRDVLFVSNINGSPLEKNGKGFISKATLTGEIENLEWVTGLNAPKGSGIWQNKFYVTDIDHLVEIDIEAGEIINKYPAENAVFLNDITVDDLGNVYISDMSEENSVIYKFSEGKLETWLQDELISRPNGLFFEKGKLFVGTGDGFLKSIDLTDKSITTIAETGFGIDGVQSDGKGNFLVSDLQGKTAFVSSAGEVKELMNTADANINSADIEFIPEKNLLLIPTFFDNRVVAYLFE
ncbi:MAG: ATP-binding protein [bacterium]|nr:ATP-binding protein [bacterium]